MTKLCFSTGMVACLVAFQGLGATYTTYNTSASFLAAAGGGAGLAFADFDALSGNTYQTLSSTTPTIPAGVVFRSSGGTTSDLFVAPAGFAGNPAITSASLFANYYGTPLIADFAPGVQAVGSDVLSYAGQATLTVTLQDSNGGLSTYTVTPPSGHGYFGIITTDGQITEISYTPPSGYTAGIDNFSFGQVPEPSTGALLLSSLGGLVFLKRRQRR